MTFSDKRNERICCQQTCTTRNAKGSSLGCREMRQVEILIDLLKVWGCKQLPETYLLQQVQVGGFWNSVPFQRNPYKKVVKIPKLVLSPE